MDTQNPLSSPVTAGHDTDAPANLIDFMARDWVDAPISVGRIANAGAFRRRRAALSQHFAGEVLLVPAGVERTRANDTNFRFRPSSDFAYLAGPGEPDALLAFEPASDGHRTILFVPPHNRGTEAFFTDRVRGELWVGRHRGVDESQLYFDVDACRPIDDVRDYLREVQKRHGNVRIVRGLDPALDALVGATDDDELAVMLAEMRLLKDETEIAELRRCVEITKRGFEDVIRLFPNARSEREVEAAFWSRARIEANDVGYLTIAASGAHACTLHWNRNEGALRPNDLLLLDAGVEAESLYTADITRTLPIGGRFSAEQRAVYDLVFEAQRAAFEDVRPGNDFLAPNRAAMRVLAEGLVELGILCCSVDEALDPANQYYRRYTLHNVSHMLGIDVHDCARARAQTYRYGTLETGMALTVEPGLYFQPDDATVPERFRGIGVRIEDDVVVTRDGHDNLSAILPSQADAVERWISEVQGKA